MNKHYLIMILSILCTMPLLAQNQNKNSIPGEQIIVNKNFDDDGNLIEYDSTYIHQWSSDTTMQFGFDDNFPMGRFPDINDFMNQFFGDSKHVPFSNFALSPFYDDPFFKRFNKPLNDSLFYYNDTVPADSAFAFPFKFGQSFPDMDKMMKDLKTRPFRQPEFKTEQQRKEWETLIKKQHKEMEDLLRKWEQ